MIRFFFRTTHDFTSLYYHCVCAAWFELIWPQTYSDASIEMQNQALTTTTTTTTAIVVRWCLEMKAQVIHWPFRAITTKKETVYLIINHAFQRFILCLVAKIREEDTITSGIGVRNDLLCDVLLCHCRSITGCCHVLQHSSFDELIPFFTRINGIFCDSNTPLKSNFGKMNFLLCKISNFFRWWFFLLFVFSG